MLSSAHYMCDTCVLCVLFKMLAPIKIKNRNISTISVTIPLVI
jgi:hypothetical protein